MARLTLYQFPHSHFSEKARWALAFKGLSFDIVNLTRGPHALKTRRMGLPETTVPILDDGGTLVQDSTRILDHLERRYPEPALDPADEGDRARARALEDMLDDHLGHDLRRVLYGTLLNYPKLVSSFFLQGKGPLAKAVFPMLFPFVRRSIRKKLRVEPELVRQSNARLQDAFDRVDALLEEGRGYLVGDRFTRADLTAAALLAPLVWPPEHDFDWPTRDQVPEGLRPLIEELESRPCHAWVLRMYRERR